MPRAKPVLANDVVPTPVTVTAVPVVGLVGATVPDARRMVTPAKSTSSGLTQDRPIEVVLAAVAVSAPTGAGAVVSGAATTCRVRTGPAKAGAPAAAAVQGR